MREQLPDIVFNAPDISPIKYDPLNPLYLIAQLLFMPEGKNVTLKKRIATELISLLRNDLRLTLPEDIQSYDIISAVNHCKKSEADGIRCLKIAIEQVLSFLHINIQKEEKLLDLERCFWYKIEERVRRYELATDYDSISKYFRDKQGIVISTIHGVKGEEYNTVIAVNLLNGYLPHWNLILQPDKKLKKSETMKLLYVLCSRAKKNLYLFSETGYMTQGGNKYTPTDELLTIDWNKI